MASCFNYLILVTTCFKSSIHSYRGSLPGSSEIDVVSCGPEPLFLMCVQINNRAICSYSSECRARSRSAMSMTGEYVCSGSGLSQLDATQTVVQLYTTYIGRESVVSQFSLTL